MTSPYVCRACCRRATLLLSRRSRRLLTTSTRSSHEQVKLDRKQNAAVENSVFDIGLDFKDDTLRLPANHTADTKVGHSDPHLEALFARKEEWQPTRLADMKPLQRSGWRAVSTSENTPSSVSTSQAPGTGQGVSQVRPPRYSRAPVQALPRLQKTEKGQKDLHPRLVKLYKTLRALKNTLDEDPSTKLHVVWPQTANALKSCGQGSQKQVIEDPQVLTLLGFIVKKVANFGVLRTPEGNVTPAEILRLYIDCGVVKGWWHTVLWIQLRNLIQDKAGGDRPVPEHKLKLVWQTFEIFVNVHLPKLDEQHNSSDSEKLSQKPRAKQTESFEIEYAKNNREGDDSKALPGLLSRFLEVFGGDQKDRRKVDKMRASAALLLLHYVEKYRLESKKPMAMNPEALQRLRLLGKGVEYDCNSFVFCLKENGASEDAIHREITAWLHSPVESVRYAAFLNPARPLPPTSTAKFTNAHLDHFYTRVNQIARNEDVFAAQDLWTRMKPSLKTDNISEIDKHKLMLRFLALFNEVRLMDRTSEVWNYMVDIGLHPDKRHWNAMITGCSRIRAVDSMQDVWENMLRNGIVPDNELWTTYIHGIIRAGKFDEGLMLLEHVGKLWKSHAQPLEPSLGPVHAALSAINDLRGKWGRTAKVSKQNLIIEWARSHSLVPTTHTYNILLEPLAPVGDPQEIKAHLDAMAAENIDPDVITWSLILKGLVSPHSPFFSLYPETQTETITDILNAMKASHCNPSGPTYTTLLFGLLDSKHREPNVQAARCVLDHMDAAGIPPSEHVHTIVLTHYFSSSPPDIHSADALLERLLGPYSPKDKVSIGQMIRLERGKNLFGSFFWNRILSLYADADQWERALHFFRMRNKSASISWMALVRMLRSLSRAKEWSLCNELVRDVLNRGGQRGPKEGILGVEDFGKTMPLGTEGGRNGSNIVGGRDGGTGGKQVWEREVESLKDRGFIRPEESSWAQAMGEGGLVEGKATERTQ